MMKTYTIGQAAQRMNLSVDTLRYYDREGLLPFVARSKNGYRVFHEEDFAWLELITCLKATGLELKEIGVFIRWSMEGDVTLQKRLDLFLVRREEVLRQMASLRQHLEKIDHKIALYQRALDEKTNGAKSP